MRIWHQGFVDFDKVPVYRKSFGEHLERVIDPGVELTIHGMRPGIFGDFTPIEALHNAYVESVLVAEICEAALCAERLGYDAVAVNCFYDPGLREARSIVNIPVVSLFESCMATSISLGGAVGMLALNEDQCDKHRELSLAYGLSGRLAATVPIDPPIDEYVLEGGSAQTADIEKGIYRACARLRSAGADVIVPGDGVLNDFVWRRSIAPDGVTMLDAAAVLVRHATHLAGLSRALGMGTARSGRYANSDAHILAYIREFAGRQPMSEGNFSGVGTVTQSLTL